MERPFISAGAITRQHHRAVLRHRRDITMADEVISRRHRAPGDVSMPWYQSQLAWRCRETASQVALRRPDIAVISAAVAISPPLAVMSRHRAEVAQPRFFVGDPASLRGLPSLPDWCAGVQRCTYRARISRSVCAAAGLRYRMPTFWLLRSVISPWYYRARRCDITAMSQSGAVMMWRSCVGEPAFLRGLPSHPDCCAGLRKCIYCTRISRRVCAAPR